MSNAAKLGSVARGEAHTRINFPSAQGAGRAAPESPLSQPKT
jgi:hypothetical protein